MLYLLGWPALASLPQPDAQPPKTMIGIETPGRSTSLSDLILSTVDPQLLTIDQQQMERATSMASLSLDLQFQKLSRKATTIAVYSSYVAQEWEITYFTHLLGF